MVNGFELFKGSLVTKHCNYLLIGDGVPCAVTGFPPGTGDGQVPPGFLHGARPRIKNEEWSAAASSHDPTQLARLGNRSLKCFGHQRLVVSLGALA